jgi:hypothetical protein
LSPETVEADAVDAHQAFGDLAGALAQHVALPPPEYRLTIAAGADAGKRGNGL